jgi:hypothetical protein
MPEDSMQMGPQDLPGMPAGQMTIEVEAESVEEARKELANRIPAGFYLLSESIVATGEPSWVMASGETAEEAAEKARRLVPPGAAVLETKQLTEAKSEVISLEANDEKSAQSSMKARATEDLGRTAGVRNLVLVQPARKGVLGLGKRPNCFSAEIFRLAEVRVIYKYKARISGRIATFEALVAALAVPADRLGAIEVLAGMGERAAEPVADALKSMPPNEQDRAIEMLQQVGDKPAPVRAVVETIMARQAEEARAEEAKKEAKLKRDFARAPESWFRAWLQSLQPNSYAVGCYYHESGACLARHLGQGDGSAFPERCSLGVQGYRNCFVWKMYPR